jgi:hypothetical protein
LEAADSFPGTLYNNCDDSSCGVSLIIAFRAEVGSQLTAWLKDYQKVPDGCAGEA